MIALLLPSAAIANKVMALLTQAVVRISKLSHLIVRSCVKATTLVNLFASSTLLLGFIAKTTVMLRLMFTKNKKLQILYRIIRPILVYVMNLLPRFKLPPQVQFHNVSVLQHMFSSNVNLAIANRIYAAGATCGNLLKKRIAVLSHLLVMLKTKTLGNPASFAAFGRARIHPGTIQLCNPFSN